jgi:hypothetical protein
LYFLKVVRTVCCRLYHIIRYMWRRA